MAESIEHIQPKIEKLKLIGKITSIVFDALSICDIENDKIQFELKRELHRIIIENLIPDVTPHTQREMRPIEDKLSITKETIESLHRHVMEVIADNLAILEIGNAEKLSDVVFEIIKYEKSHRDKEAMSRLY